MSAVLVYQVLDLPYVIRLDDDGVCEFRSLLRRRRIPARQITALTDDEEKVYVHHTDGRVRMFYEMQELPDFLGRLRALNSAIRFEGWVADQARVRSGSGGNGGHLPNPEP